MTEPKYRKVGSSTTTTIDNKRRREVTINAPACWVEDYEAEIYSPVQKYSSIFLIDGSEADRVSRARYKLLVPLKSSSKITAEIRFITQGGAMSIGGQELPLHEAVGMQEVVDEGLATYWNNLFKVKISDPICGVKNMDLEFRAIWLPTTPSMSSTDVLRSAQEGEYHRKLIVYESMVTESVSNFIMELALSSNSYIAAHEFAHCLGIPDEYQVEENYGTLKYIKPDGKYDNTIDLKVRKEKSSPLATIMSTAYINRRLPRHAWNIAIEVQELLSKKLGRKIKCDII
jgi:type VI secretion system secreted protein VgrG